MSLHGSEIDFEIQRIVRWHERRRSRHVVAALMIGAALGIVVDSLVRSLL